MNTEQAQAQAPTDDALYARCKAAHLADLHAGAKGRPAPELMRCLDACLHLGQRELFIQARREASRQFTEEVIADGHRVHAERSRRG